MTPPTPRRLRGRPITSSGPCRARWWTSAGRASVQVRTTGREKSFWLKQDSWKRLLHRGDASDLKWVTWPPLFRALEQIWLRLQDKELHTLGALLQASEVRQLLLEVRPGLERAGFNRLLSDDRQHLGESYLPVFIEDVRKLLV